MSGASPRPWKRGEEHENKIEILDAGGQRIATVHASEILGPSWETAAANADAIVAASRGADPRAEALEGLPCFYEWVARDEGHSVPVCEEIGDPPDEWCPSCRARSLASLPQGSEGAREDEGGGTP